MRQHGTTVVLVTDFMDEAEALCDRVAVFAQHHVVTVDSPARLVDRYGHTTVVFSAEGPVEFLREVPAGSTSTQDGPGSCSWR